MDRTRSLTVHPAVSEALDRAVRAGIVDRVTADAITAVARSEPTAPPGLATRRVSPLVEALTYVGSCLLMVGACIVVSQHWDELPGWARPTLLAAAACALVAVGALYGDATPITWRLRNVTWLLGLGALAGCLGVLTVDTAGWSGAPVATTIGTGVAVTGSALWRRRNLPLVHVGTFIGLAVATGGVLDAIEGAAAIGLGVMALGFTWMVLRRYDVVPPAELAVPLGMVALLIGPQITIGSWHTTAPVIGLCVASGLVVAGAVLHTFVLTAGGVLGLFLYLPLTVARVFHGAGGPAAVLLVSGALLLAVVTVVVRHGPHGSAGAAT